MQKLFDPVIIYDLIWVQHDNHVLLHVYGVAELFGYFPFRISNEFLALMISDIASIIPPWEA